MDLPLLQLREAWKPCMFYIASELSTGKEAMKSVYYKQRLAIVAGLLDTVEILRQSFCRTQRQLGEHWRAAT